jgi:hypothetical protein
MTFFEDLAVMLLVTQLNSNFYLTTSLRNFSDFSLVDILRSPSFPSRHSQDFDYLSTTSFRNFVHFSMLHVIQEDIAFFSTTSGRTSPDFNIAVLQAASGTQQFPPASGTQQFFYSLQRQQDSIVLTRLPAISKIVNTFFQEALLCNSSKHFLRLTLFSPSKNLVHL